MQYLPSTFVSNLQNSTFWKQLHEHYPVLKRQAISLTKQVATAEDLVHDVLIKAFLNQNRYREGTNLGAWLYTVMRNTYLSQLRRRQEVLVDPSVSGAVDGEAEVFDYAEAEEIVHDTEILLHCLAGLSSDMVDPLLLIQYSEHKYEEVAVLLNLKKGTVKSRVNRAQASILGLTKKGEIPLHDIEAWLSNNLARAEIMQCTELVAAYQNLNAVYRVMDKRLGSPNQGLGVQATEEPDFLLDEFYGEY